MINELQRWKSTYLKSLIFVATLWIRLYYYPIFQIRKISQRQIACKWWFEDEIQVILTLYLKVILFYSPTYVAQIKHIKIIYTRKEF